MAARAAFPRVAGRAPREVALRVGSVCADEIVSFVRRRLRQRRDASVAEPGRSGERTVASGAAVRCVEVRRGSMGVASDAAFGRRPGDVHPLTAVAAMTRRASDIAGFRKMFRVREGEETRPIRSRRRPLDPLLNRAVVALGAGSRRRVGSGRIAGWDASVTAQTCRKERCVPGVRKRLALLRREHGRSHGKQHERQDAARHQRDPPRPGSRPTVHSKRMDARRCDQSGPGAPFDSAWRYTPASTTRRVSPRIGSAPETANP